MKNSYSFLNLKAHEDPSISPSIGEYSDPMITFRRFFIYSWLAPSFLATFEDGTYASFKHSSSAFSIFSSVYNVSIGIIILVLKRWFSYILFSSSIRNKGNAKFISYCQVISSK